ncbi:hypothetical protein PTKIN_Ptkin07bG0039800 [Pterospermum kingtungense]
MAEEIQSLMNNFSLEGEDEKDIVLDKSRVEESVKESGLNIQDMGHHVFFFQFEDILERDRVLIKQPWAFNKSLLVLQEFDGLKAVGDLVFHHCPFWVQIIGLPCGLMSERIGIVIGETLGEVEEVDLDENYKAWGKALRVRIQLDLRRPLKRQRNITIDSGGKVTVKFRYERLSDVCCVCGMLTHQESECATWIRMKKDGAEVIRAFGPWLRAEYHGTGLESSTSCSFSGTFSGFDCSGRFKECQSSGSGMEVSDESTTVPVTQGAIDIAPIIQDSCEAVKKIGVENKIVGCDDVATTCDHRSHAYNVEHKGVNAKDSHVVLQAIDLPEYESGVIVDRQTGLNGINALGQQNEGPNNSSGPNLVDVPVFTVGKENSSPNIKSTWKRRHNRVA